MQNAQGERDWTERWNEKVDEIDARIIAFFKRAGAKMEDLYEDISAQFRNWAHSKGEDASHFEREHPTNVALRERVSSRVEELERMGRIERQRESLLNK